MAVVSVILVTAIIRTLVGNAVGLRVSNSAARITYDVTVMLCGAAISAVVVR